MNNFALVIGVDRYWDALAHLRCAVADALAFAGWLVDEGLVPRHQLRLALARHGTSASTPAALKGDVLETDACADDLFDGLEWLVNVTEGASADRVFFYFSGHGLSIIHPDLSRADVICAADYRRETGRHALLLDSIAGRLRAIACAEQFMLVDACRSPRQGDAMNGERVAKFGIAANPAPLQFIFKATAQGDKAFEEDRGAFTSALIDALGRGDGGGRAKTREADGSYVVRWRRLTEKVALEVAARKRDADGEVQTPRIDGETDPTNDPAFARIAAVAVPPATLVVEATPAGLPAGARVETLLLGEMKPCHARIIDGRAEMSLIQASYLVCATAPGYKPSAVTPIELYEPMLRRTLELQALPKRRSLATAMQLATRGRALVSIRCQDPLVRLSLETQDGRVLKAGAGSIEQSLRAGAYQARAIGPEGQEWLEPLAVGRDRIRSVDLAPPRERTPAMEAALAATRSGLLDIVYPFDQAEAVAAANLATLVVMSLAQAVAGHVGETAGGLCVGRHWLAAGSRTGVAVLVVDERPEAILGEGTAPCVSLGHFPDLARVVGEGLGVPAKAFPQIRETAIEAEAGAYWLALSDMEAGVPGFLVPLVVLDSHVTALFLHRSADGVGRLMQMCLARPSAGARSSGFRAVRPAEYLQRTRLSRRLAAEDAVVLKLLKDEWFEPVSAAIAIYDLAGSSARLDMDQQLMLRALRKRLQDRAPALPDLIALADGGSDGLVIPLVAEGLIALAADQRNVALRDLAAAAVPHRLWSMWSRTAPIETPRSCGQNDR